MTSTTDITDTLAEHTAAIRALGKRAVADVIEIGARLSECKRICGHGNWLSWLNREFGWTEQTALNFMRVAELNKSKTVLNLDLPIKSLYLLAAPSTPAEACDAIIEQARTGKSPAVVEVKEAIATAKGRHQPAKTATATKTKTAAGATTTTKKTTAADATEQQQIAAREAQARAAQNVGEHSSGEIKRKLARLEELEREVVRLKRENLALNSQIEEQKATPTDPEELELLRELARFVLRCSGQSRSSIFVPPADGQKCKRLLERVVAVLRGGGQ